MYKDNNKNKRTSMFPRNENVTCEIYIETVRFLLFDVARLGKFAHQKNNSQTKLRNNGNVAMTHYVITA